MKMCAIHGPRVYLKFFQPASQVITSKLAYVYAQMRMVRLDFNFSPPLVLKEPSRDFFSKPFTDFGSTRKLYLFHTDGLTIKYFTAGNCSVWKILMKMYLVMVTMIKLTQQNIIGNCNIQIASYIQMAWPCFNRNFKLTYLEWWFFKWNRKQNFEKQDCAPLH